MLTDKMIKSFPDNWIIAAGSISNNLSGIFVSRSRMNEELVWIAVTGYAGDWAIYCGFRKDGIDNILRSGHKITIVENIKKLLPCTDQAIALYRF